jgi:endonuclease/exonuclease/phosphatase family metal-dependent hydrolase/tetratricopeptide (TPR) repeat protein
MTGFRPHRRFVWAYVFLACLIVGGGAQRAQSDDSLTVMSFNIRYGTANDGENRWERRRELLFSVIRDARADVIGLQEALDFQIDEIAAAVPGYAVVGVGRDDGARKGEYAAILFRADKLQLAGAGTFWFSDTPEVVASRSWGNTITRICTWARFVDRRGRAFWHFNVHLDHQSQPSREKSTQLLLERIDARRQLGRYEPVIVTGDFNVGEDNPALATLTQPGAAGAPRFVDTFRVRHRDATDVNTFTAFTFGRVAGAKIDYILVEPGTEVRDAAIVRTSAGDRYPSDHFPVTAQVRLANAEATSLLGRPLVAPPIAADARARMEAQLAEAQAALARGPANADALIWVGRRTAYLGRFRDAIAIFTRGIAAHPTDARFYRHRGHRYLSVREIDRAIADLERAGTLIAGQTDQIEPDGQPNARNIPTSSLHSNIWYHLALAYYLKGDFARAAPVWERAREAGRNPDNLVAASHWLYLTLRRLNREADANAVLAPIRADLDVIENGSYHSLLLLYKGERSADAVLQAAPEGAGGSAVRYGVSAWHLVNGRRTDAERMWTSILAGPDWPSFGHLAAEAEVARARQ